ncbi:MAG: HNH endonuclease [Proteobacteria bacterium]|nr:MAG: HNH endonuclease [Pseudomonadota bacterium]
MPNDQESKPLRAHETKSRYIPAQVRHELWQRNNGQGCEFASNDGARCGSHHALQMDHVYGFARGGDHAPENLQILCAAHNRYVWRLARGTVKEPRAAYEASARSKTKTQPKARCA